MPDRNSFPSAFSPQPERLNLLRRIGRKGMRMVRPLFLPLLDRLHVRTQSAIDQSSVSVRLHAIESSQAAIVALLQAQARDQASNADAVRDVLQKSSAQSGLFQDVSARLDRLQVGIDALRLDQLELARRADAEAVREALRKGIEQTGTLLQEASANVGRLHAEVGALRQDQIELAHKAGNEAADAARRGQAFNEKVLGALAGISDAQAENFKLATQLVARADVIIQRASLLSLGNEVLLQTPEGFLLVPAEDRTLLAAMWHSGGRLEPGTVKVLTAVLREGDQFIDVGAHIGLTVLPAALKVGPRGRVVAFEPGSRAALLLEQNLALNFVSERVAVHRCAAGDAAGKARLHLSPILGESSLLDLPVSQGGEDVDIRTVDSQVEPGRPVRLVKIDAEGYEPQVWRGMQRIVRDNPELVALVEFGPAHLRRAGIAVEDWIAGFTAPGFTLYEVDETTAAVRPVRPAAALGEVTSLNLLMLRQPPAMFPELRFE